MRYFLIGLIFAACAAGAQEWNGRAGDVVLSLPELSDRLTGQTITFYDNGQSVYFADGRYTYTYDGGGTAHGYYRLQAGGVVCIDFVHGFQRCDRFVLSGDRLILQTADGDRFPVRPQS